MSISKFHVTVLMPIVLITSINLFYFAREQVSARKTISKQSFSPTACSASPSTTLATQLISNDTNWAGYIVASDVQNPQATVTRISASWTVPTVVISSNDTFSAVWIGIGGFFDQSLIQVGTEQDSIQGQSDYSAWLELLPHTSITIDSITISPGDQINASIQIINSNTDEWAIYIKDLTTNQEFTNNFYYVASQLSAEWIVERPEITSPRSHSTLAALADVGKVKFIDCEATIGDTTGSITSFPVVQSIMFENVQDTNDLGTTQLAAVSDITDNGSSFTVETTPSYVPELSVLIVLPLIIGTGLLGLSKKRRKSQLTTQKVSRCAA